MTCFCSVNFSGIIFVAENRTSNLLQCLSVVADMGWHICSWIASGLTDFSRSWQSTDALAGHGCAKALQPSWQSAFEQAGKFELELADFKEAECV